MDWTNLLWIGLIVFLVICFLGVGMGMRRRDMRMNQPSDARHEADHPEPRQR